MMSLPAMTNQSASHRGIANQIDTTTRFCNAQVIKNMSGAGPLRNRSFATDGQGHRPTRDAVCRILCLILCLAYVWRVGQCRAPHERRAAAVYTATSCRISAVLTAPLNTGASAINCCYPALISF